jgi:hypothetical protein
MSVDYAETIIQATLYCEFPRSDHRVGFKREPILGILDVEDAHLDHPF